MKKLMMAMFLVLSIDAVAFDFTLDFHGRDPARLKAMGCKCDTQAELDAFLSGFYTKVAKKLHERGKAPVGILNANSCQGTGFFNTFSENLCTHFSVSDRTPFIRPIALVNFDEHGDIQ